MHRRPILVLLTSSWISMLGAALVTLAGFSWLFVLPLNVRGQCQQSLHRAAGLHRDSSSLLRRAGADSDRYCPGQAQGHRGTERAAGSPNGLAPRGDLFRGDDACQRGHRQPAQLSRRRAHGHRSVLRRHLPRHEARVHRPRRSTSASGRGLRRVPHRSRSHRLVERENGRHQPIVLPCCSIHFRGPSSRLWRTTSWSPRPTPASNVTRARDQSRRVCA